MKNKTNQTTVATVATETHRIQVRHYATDFEVVFEGTLTLTALTEALTEYAINQYSNAWLTADGITIRAIPAMRTIRIDWPPMPKLQPVAVGRYQLTEQEENEAYLAWLGAEGAPSSEGPAFDIDQTDAEPVSIKPPPKPFFGPDKPCREFSRTIKW
jgi:hypothetical protein